jgi:hypothetical protein
VIWWSIPIMATLVAWLWTRYATGTRRSVRTRPEPGSPQDAAELTRLSAALARPLPERGRPAHTGPSAPRRAGKEPSR